MQMDYICINKVIQMATYQISYYLDTRRAKQNGNYPIKLQVYTSNPKKQKLYSTDYEATKEEYRRAFLTDRPQKDYKKLKKDVEALITRADDVAKELKPFTFDLFEKHYFRAPNEGCKLSYQYEQKIQRLTKNGQAGTAQSYKDSKNSLSLFAKEVKKTKFEDLSFYDITKDWLEDYEHWMLNQKNRTPTTVGIYVRPLRTLYNVAIDEKEIKREYYPFGKRGYIIPTAEKKKKALSKEQLEVLFNALPSTPQQEKAKDFWFLSYSCNGINMKDLLQLKYKDFDGDKFEFVRAKTQRTTKGKLSTITVYLNDFTKGIFEKYGNANKTPESYVFDVLSDTMTPAEIKANVQNFTRLINQHIKKLCKANSLPEVSTYWARHSFATVAVRKGASIEFMRESLGHQDVKTTLGYFAGFDNETKKEFANQLMEF